MRQNSDRAQRAAIRAWARSRGFEVSERGRTPQHILEKYHAGAAASEADVVVDAKHAARRRSTKSS